MSVEAIRCVVEDFARGDTTGVLVVKGRWGAGKTHFWRQLVKQLAEEGELGHERYSYVSLFGLSTLADFKNALFTEQRSQKDIAGAGRSVSSILGSMKELARSFTDFPQLQGWGGLADAAAYAFVKDMLICIDDLERKGAGLRMRDVIGLVSQLREERGCTVCIILNEDALSEDERTAFRKHGEKVFDTEVHFVPTAEEAAQLGVPSDHPHEALLRECCAKLRITNIRIVQRIARTAHRLDPFLEGHASATVERALRSVALLTWSYHDEDGDAPPFSWTRQPRSVVDFYLEDSHSDVKPLKEHLVWRETLQNYDHYIGEGLDQEIVSFIERGFFNEGALRSHLREEDEKIKEEERESAIRKAWDLYRDSFDDNEDEFAETLVRGALKSVSQRQAADVSTIARTLRELERHQEADSIVDAYVDSHSKDRSVLDFRRYAFSDRVNDTYLIRRLDEALKAAPDERVFAEVLEEEALAGGWSRDGRVFLSGCSVDEYYNYFRAAPADLRHASIKWCLKAGRIIDGSEGDKAIAAKATEALRRIAQECRLNRLRVENLYGITVEDGGEGA